MSWTSGDTNPRTENSWKRIISEQHKYENKRPLMQGHESAVLSRKNNIANSQNIHSIDDTITNKTSSYAGDCFSVKKQTNKNNFFMFCLSFDFTKHFSHRKTQLNLYPRLHPARWLHTKNFIRRWLLAFDRAHITIFHDQDFLLCHDPGMLSSPHVTWPTSIAHVSLHPTWHCPLSRDK